MDTDYIRRCPSCHAENAPSVMRCACGALLAGIDLVSRQTLQAAVAPTALAKAETVPTAATIACPHDDCGQPNPAGSENCLYCNRPLNNGLALSQPDQLRSLLNLPAALKDRYHILQPMPARGAEAELLLVEALTGGPTRVAKIYRHGILPKSEVQERIAKVSVEHRVEVIETGISEGYAYELMELCTGGSLRKLMDNGPMAAGKLYDLVRELSTALSNVHAAGLVHRDLKPENILIRTEQPLDLVLTDFSISSILDATQRFTGVARTLPYASPESLSGVIDSKADYWALGMLILECTLGKHPFAELSEPVILHHLTTRNIDLAEVSDHKTRKLLRGLFQRDPKLRWGNEEITRWLADDASLAEPAETAVGLGFTEPYHIANEICHKPEQLAVALARHWQEGVSDLANGQLLTWFREVQKDQNVVRLLLDNQFEKKLPTDVQLLKLILHLAPGIPPVWRGETIALTNILAQANLALKGDNDAANWLDKLYQHRVLEVYAQAGNQQAFDLVQRWNRACDQFAQAWQEKLDIIKSEEPEQNYLEIVNFGQLQYGVNDPHRPPLAKMHARMLAIAYDASWAERLRQRLLAELTELSIHCSWFVALGDPKTMDAASLLVLEALLPEAKKTAELKIKADQHQRETEAGECKAFRKEAVTLITALRKTAKNHIATPGICRELSAILERYLNLVVSISASGRSDTPWQEMKTFALQARITARVMLNEINSLTEHRAVTMGWLNMAVLRVFVLAAGFLFIILGVKGLHFLIAAGIVGIAWRLVPDILKMRKIRKLAKSL